MGRLLKLIGFLIVLAVIALIGFAYLGDLSPDQSDIREPVELDEN